MKNIKTKKETMKRSMKLIQTMKDGNRDAQQLLLWGRKKMPTEKYKEFRKHPVGQLGLILILEEMILEEEGLL